MAKPMIPTDKITARAMLQLNESFGAYLHTANSAAPSLSHPPIPTSQSEPAKVVSYPQFLPSSSFKDAPPSTRGENHRKWVP
jgi:hypothetical protein